MLDVAQFTMSKYSTSICVIIADEHVGSTDATGPGATGPGATALVLLVLVLLVLVLLVLVLLVLVLLPWCYWCLATKCMCICAIAII